tara:strand:+ start:187 stop:504 length:318 start_codon:yes stop_codon:yes gene_type:complete
MSLKKIQYPELGIDIEIEQLGSILKFFKHNDSKYFGQCVISTGEVGDGVVKGLMSPRMPFKERKALDSAIRRTLLSMGYKTGSYQRKVNGRFRTKRVATPIILSN